MTDNLYGIKCRQPVATCPCRACWLTRASLTRATPTVTWRCQVCALPPTAARVVEDAEYEYDLCVHDLSSLRAAHAALVFDACAAHSTRARELRTAIATELAWRESEADIPTEPCAVHGGEICPC